MSLTVVSLLYLSGFAGIAAIFFWHYLFGGLGFAHVDVGGDSFVQFYPLNVEFARQFAEGTGPSWSFRLGLGGYTGTHFDPFWMVQALLPESMQLQARIYSYLAKLALGGWLMLLYARLIGLPGVIALATGLAWAFSDYALINGQWDLLHATEVFHFAALVLLLEKYWRTGSAWFALLTGLLLGLSHPFNLYTSAFFSLLYLLARGLIAGGPRQPLFWLRRLSSLACGVVAGLLMLAPVLLPNLNYFLDSPRVLGEHASMQSILGHILDINSLQTIVITLMGFLGKGVNGFAGDYAGITNFLEGPGFYVGLPALLFMGQLAGPEASSSERRLFWLAIIGIGLYVVFPAFRHAAFGFNHGGFRVSTLWISMLVLIAGALGARRMLASGLSVRWMLVPAGLVLVAIVLAAASRWPRINGHYLSAVAAFIALYVLALTAPTLGKPAPASDLAGTRRRLAMVLAVVLCLAAVERVVLLRPATVDRSAADLASNSAIGSFDDGTAQAVDWLGAHHTDGTFFRVEKDYTSVFLLDSLVQGYHGIRSYFFHGTSLTRFIDHIGWPRTIPHSNYIDLDMSRTEVLDLLAVRYVLARDRSRDDDAQSRWLATVGDIHIYERTGAASLARLHWQAVPESQASALSGLQRSQLMDGAVVIDTDEIPAWVSSDLIPASVPVTMVNQQHLRGRFDAPSPAMLALAMPFDRGWRLHLGDGRQLPLLRINYGLTGAVVPEGDHAFELRYRPPGRDLGYRIAPAGLLLAGFLVWIGTPGKRRRIGVMAGTP